MSIDRGNLKTDHIGNYDLMPLTEYLEKRYPGVPVPEFVDEKLASTLITFEFAMKSENEESRDLEDILNKQFVPVVAVNSYASADTVPFMLDTQSHQYILYSKVLEQLQNESFHTKYSGDTVYQLDVVDIEDKDFRSLIDGRIEQMDDSARTQYQRICRRKEQAEREQNEH